MIFNIEGNPSAVAKWAYATGDEDLFQRACAEWLKRDPAEVKSWQKAERFHLDQQLRELRTSA